MQTSALKVLPKPSSQELEAPASTTTTLLRQLGTGMLITACAGTILNSGNTGKYTDLGLLAAVAFMGAMVSDNIDRY